MSELADWLTIIGFIITILTYLVVRSNKKEINELNRKNFFVNRTPENLKELKNSSLALSRLISNLEENKREVLLEISKIAPILKSLKKSLREHDLEYFNLLKVEVDKHRNIFYKIEDVSWLKRKLKLYVILDEKYVDKTFIFLTTLITDIESLDKDFKKDLLK